MFTSVPSGQPRTAQGRRGTLRALGFTVAALAGPLSGAAVAAPPVATPSVIEVASATPELSTLVEAVQAAGLVDALSGPGPYTVFAPTNEAFAVLIADLGVTSLGDIPVETLRAVLLSHVIAGRAIPAQAFPGLQLGDVRVQTAGPLALTFETSVRPFGPRVNGVEIIATNVRASNGIVHVLGAVLPVPDSRPTLTEAAVALSGLGQFTTLTAAVVKTGLAGVLADPSASLTVFAPTDAAFKRLGWTATRVKALQDPSEIEVLRAILLDHVIAKEAQASELAALRVFRSVGDLPLYISGRAARVNGIDIVVADAVDARNGVLHVIDGVLVQRR